MDYLYGSNMNQRLLPKTPIFLFGCLALCLASCSNDTLEPPSKTETIPAEDLQTGEIQWIDPNDLQQGPIQRDSLTPKQIERISALQKVFVEIDGKSVEEWADNFKRDLNPDNELAIWERMAKSYTRYCRSHELTLDGKSEVYKIVLLRSMASPDDVLSRLQLTTLSKEDALEVMANY